MSCPEWWSTSCPRIHWLSHWAMCWVIWSSCRCPFSMQESLTTLYLKVLSKANSCVGMYGIYRIVKTLNSVAVFILYSCPMLSYVERLAQTFILLLVNNVLLGFKLNLLRHCLQQLFSYVSVVFLTFLIIMTVK